MSQGEVEVLVLGNIIDMYDDCAAAQTLLQLTPLFLGQVDNNYKKAKESLVFIFISKTFIHYSQTSFESQ